MTQRPDVDVVSLPRHRRQGDDPHGEPTGEPIDADLARRYLDAAHKALQEPGVQAYRDASTAAFMLGCRYTSMDALWASSGGFPREAQAGRLLFQRARAYRALADTGSGGETSSTTVRGE